MEPTNPRGEAAVFDELTGLLSVAAAGRTIRQAFFMRKPPGLRLRFLPARNRRALLDRLLQQLAPLRRSGQVRRLYASTYEPESYQFGGPEAMALVHAYFTADTQLWLRRRKAVARDQTALADDVLCLALVNELLFRCLDDAREEAWDVWCNLARLHGFPERADSAPDGAPSTLPAIRPRDLLEAGTAAEAMLLRRYERSLAALASGLARLQVKGRLLYGLRQVLPWIVIFQWNRYALSMERRQRLCAAMVQALNPKLLLRRPPARSAGGKSTIAEEHHANG